MGSTLYDYTIRRLTADEIKNMTRLRGQANCLLCEKAAVYGSDYKTIENGRVGHHHKELCEDHGRAFAEEHHLHLS